MVICGVAIPETIFSAVLMVFLMSSNTEMQSPICAMKVCYIFALA